MTHLGFILHRSAEGGWLSLVHYPWVGITKTTLPIVIDQCVYWPVNLISPNCWSSIPHTRHLSSLQSSPAWAIYILVGKQSVLQFQLLINCSWSWQWHTEYYNVILWYLHTECIYLYWQRGLSLYMSAVCSVRSTVIMLRCWFGCLSYTIGIWETTKYEQLVKWPLWEFQLYESCEFFKWFGAFVVLEAFKYICWQDISHTILST